MKKTFWACDRCSDGTEVKYHPTGSDCPHEKASTRAPAPEGLDLPWIIRSLEVIAKPMGENETGAARMASLDAFIENLRGRLRAGAQGGGDHAN